jgi:hypothetical protein
MITYQERRILCLGSAFGDILVLISAITWCASTVEGRGFLSHFNRLQR